MPLAILSTTSMSEGLRRSLVGFDHQQFSGFIRAWESAARSGPATLALLRGVNFCSLYCERRSHTDESDDLDHGGYVR